ncbi:uncharacterized protein C22orf15 homolog [Ciconia maguari]
MATWGFYLRWPQLLLRSGHFSATCCASCHVHGAPGFRVTTLISHSLSAANCQEMVNLQCHILILTAHLKKKCQCRPEDCINLLDETGTLMNLSKMENPASEFTSKYPWEREHCILISPHQGATDQCRRKTPNSGGDHSTDWLQKLSANIQMRDQWRRGSLRKRAQPLTSTPARPTSQSKKSSELKGTSR